jgi:hypothetical protein
MPDETTIDEALCKENRTLPTRPVIETIEADYIEDSSGGDSLEVWVVLSDPTMDDE